MPLVGSTAYPFASDVLQLARSLLNDADVPAVQIIAATGAVRGTDLVTITTTAPHGLQIENIVQIADVYDSTFNGTFSIASVPTATTFTYGQTAADSSSGNGTVSNIIQGDVFTDTVLLPFVNSAYRKVQGRLLGAGSTTTSGVTVLTLPAGTTYIDDSTAPQLPNNFLAPRTMQERITGQPFFGSPMGRVDIVPSGPQQTYNFVFSWQDEALHFRGSTNSLDVKLTYEKSPLNIIQDGTAQLLIRGCTDAVTQYTCYLAAKSRGSSSMATFKNDFEEDMHELQNWQAHSRQYKPARRRNYNSGRGRGRGWGTV